MHVGAEYFHTGDRFFFTDVNGLPPLLDLKHPAVVSSVISSWDGGQNVAA